MKRVILILVLVTNALLLDSQNNNCINTLDTAGVITIAKRKNAYWTEHWAFKPKISFNGQNCEWTVESLKMKHSNKGNCKHTNGCTEITKVKLVIAAKTRKVKSRKEEKELRPNYE